MALDQISAITQKVFVKRVVDNILSSNPLLIYMVRKSTKLSGGATIVQPVALSTNTTATSYSGADEFDVKFEEELQGAEWNWCQYAVTISITGLDDLRNSGPHAIVNLLRTKVQMGEASLRAEMGADLQSDGTNNDSKALVGLGAAIDDGTNVQVYGGLSRVTYPTWGAQYSAASGVGRALTMSLLNTNFENCSKDNERPNLLVTTHGVYSKYMGLLQPGTRYASDGILGNMGFQNVLYQNRPLVVDEQVSYANSLHRIWMINTNYFDLYSHIDRNFKFVPFQQLPAQDAAVAKILWAGQLVCSSPRLSGVTKDIDITL